MRSEVESLREQRDEAKKELQGIQAEPESLQKQRDGLEKTLKGLKNQEEKQTKRMNEMENKEERYNNRLNSIKEKLGKMNIYHEHLVLSIEEKEKEVDELNKELEQEHANAEEHKQEQARVQAELKHKLDSERQEQEVLSKTNAEKARILKRLRKEKDALNFESSKLSPLENEKHNLINERASYEREVQQVKDASEGIRKEVDISMNDYLHQEHFGKEKATLLRQTSQEIAELEEEISRLRKEEQDRRSVIKRLTQQREQMSRLATTRVRHHYLYAHLPRIPSVTGFFFFVFPFFLPSHFAAAQVQGH